MQSAWQKPTLEHRCKVTVIDKKCYQDLQSTYLADPNSGPCSFYKLGDEFLFYRYKDEDTFWTQGKGTQCSEAWDCISRYIYTALQGGSIMRHWTNDERMMIACCNDGTRPVIFKIERQDYFVIQLNEPNKVHAEQIKQIIEPCQGVDFVCVRLNKGWVEVYVKPDEECTVVEILAKLETEGISVQLDSVEE